MCPPWPKKTGTTRTESAPFATSMARASCSDAPCSRYARATASAGWRFFRVMAICSKGRHQSGSFEPCANNTTPSFKSRRCLRSMQRGAAPLEDALQEPQGAEADGVMRERMAEVLHDVERHGHVQAEQHACGALGVDARDDRVILAVHKMDARCDAGAFAGQAR